MSAKYKSPSFLLPNELNTSANPLNTDGNPATGTGVNSLYSTYFPIGSFANLDNLTQTIKQGNLLTVSYWYYPTNGGGDGYMIGSGQASNGPFESRRSGFNIRMTWKNSSNASFVITTTNSSITLNNWMHICCIWDTTNSVSSDKMQIWINGVRNTTLTGSGTTATGSGFSSSFAATSTWINQFRPGTTSQRSNYIDELAFFNKALTSTEIAALYDGTGSNIRPSNLMATNLNPIAYYPLGEQAQNTGYLGNEITNGWQFPNGVLQDYVMDFDGGDYIDLNGSQKTMIGENANFTISVWFNTSKNTFQGVFGSFDSPRFYLAMDRGSGRFYMALGGATNASEVINFSLNTWHNIIVVKDGNIIKYYLDGSLGSTRTNAGGGYGTHTQNLFLGAYNQTGNINYFTGKLSNMAIWKTAITDANQIADIYNNSSPQTSYTVSPQNWWKLNAGSVYTPSVSKYPTALEFSNAAQSEINTGVISSLNNTTAFTVSFWMLRTATHSSLSPFFFGNRDTSNSYRGIAFSMGRDTPSQRTHAFYVYNVTGGYSFYEFPADYFRELNTWHHIVLTWDSSRTPNNFIGYWNGSNAVSQNDTTATQVPSTGNFFIGADSTSTHFSGQMSNFAIYNSALTADQVSTLFNFGTPEVNTSFSPTHNWKLDNLTTGLNDVGSLASNNGSNTAAVEVNSNVAVIPSWKIPSALTIPTVNYTSALEFNRPTANNEYVNIGTIPFLNQAGDFTISQWVNPAFLSPSFPNHNMPIQFGGQDFIYLKNNAWQYEFRNGLRQYVSGQPAVPEEEWIHIALTVEGTVSKFYQNGSLIHTGAVGTTYSANAVRIGNWFSSTYPWYGQISNTALFNSALSGPNITTLYNNGQPEATPSFSPLHWWKLDNTTTGIQDSVGSSNGTLVQTSAPGAEEVFTNVYASNLLPTNGVSTTLPSTALQQSDLQFDSPYSNYSLNFDGATTSITCNNSSIFDFGTGDFAWSLWINYETHVNYAGLLYTGATNSEYRLKFQTSGQILFLQNADGDSQVADLGTNITGTGWHHLCLVRSSGTITTYLDGSAVDTDLRAGNVNSNGNDLIIGNNGSSRLSGKIDETSMFNYGLSSAQVLEIYNNGRPKDLSTFSGTAPISWWRLGENAYFDNNAITVPNSISGAPNGVGPGTVVNMLSADAPGTYANGIGTNLDIVDRVGDAALSVANSQSYNMIPDDKIPYVPGYVGNQISNTSEMTFNGVDDYFNIGNVSSLNFERTDVFSISAWVKRVGSGTTQFIFSKATNSSPYTGYSIYINPSNQIASNINISYASNHLSVNGNSTLNTSWNHVCVTYDGSSNASGIKLYVNGSEETTSSTGQASITGTLSNSYPVNIAARNSSDLFFNGQIDEVAIFDKALTADQVKFDLYEPTATGTNQTADIANNPNLPTPVAWYRMVD